MCACAVRAVFAGDLSVGDPGFSGAGSSSAWLSAAGGELLSAPKRVTGLGVSYQRTAKQVDVRALKDLMWDSLVGVHGMDAGSSTAAAAPEQAVVPFQSVIERVPAVSAAGALPDVSVHMCFICMLHLANERGLVIKGREDLAGLSISNVTAGSNNA